MGGEKIWWQHCCARLDRSRHSPQKRRTANQSQRDYETVGYVINGRAELHLEGQKVVLEPGDSWVVPTGAVPTYSMLESCTAVEATYPPAHVHGRDEG